MKGAAPFALLLLAACSQPPLPGGSRMADGMYWRLNLLGEGERTPTDSDSVLVRVRVARQGAPPGSAFSTEQWYPMDAGRSTSRWFGRMREGDSATMLLRPRLVPWAELGASAAPSLPDTAWVQLELSTREIRSLQRSRELAHAALMARTRADEERIMATFFAGHPGGWKQALGLWYQMDSAAATGPRVQSGQLVTLAYTASFLDNGRVFDERTQQEGGLTFRLGDPDQVIKGLEAAAHLLPQQGGTGQFVIPAALAFGPDGSSSQIVPPWTPVLYVVTVMPQGPPLVP